MKDKTGGFDEIYKIEKSFMVKSPFPVINRSHTAALCSVRSVREQQKSQIFFRDRPFVNYFLFPKKWGIEIENTSERILFTDGPVWPYQVRFEILMSENSGTTTRLISGYSLARQDFTSELTGDASIQKRPDGTHHQNRYP